MKDARYKIVYVNKYWKYHVYRKVLWFFWTLCYKTDHYQFAVDYINRKCGTRFVDYYDNKGNKIE